MVSCDGGAQNRRIPVGGLWEERGPDDRSNRHDRYLFDGQNPV
jgi:hypothetical protein